MASTALTATFALTDSDPLILKGQVCATGAIEVEIERGDAWRRGPFNADAREDDRARRRECRAQVPQNVR
jgi:hypothetical protein